jgi:hypothetical protein
MACALPGIASGIGIDPTLPRDGTDFITLESVIRISCLVNRVTKAAREKNR